jgi:hypothetical protein
MSNKNLNLEVTTVQTRSHSNKHPSSASHSVKDKLEGKSDRGPVFSMNNPESTGKSTVATTKAQINTTVADERNFAPVEQSTLFVSAFEANSIVDFSDLLSHSAKSGTNVVPTHMSKISASNVKNKTEIALASSESSRVNMSLFEKPRGLGSSRILHNRRKWAREGPGAR